MARLETYKKKPIVSKGWIITGLIASILVVISSILLFFYPFASSEKTSYFTGENPVLFQGKQQGNAIVDGDSVYVSLDFLKENIDDSVAFDEKSNSIIITTSNKVVQMPTESLTYFINEKPVELQFPPLVDEQGQLYVALDPIIQYYPITYRVLENSNAIWIEKDGDTLQNAVITNKDVHEEKLRLRTDATLQSPYFTEVSNGEKIWIEEEKEEFYFVRKIDGVAGYISKDLIETQEKEIIAVEYEKEAVNAPTFEGPINLTWEAVYTKNPDTTMIPEMNGVNVVSPTWFELKDETGSIGNLASLEYSKWAKAQGYQVWGLFSNAFDPDLTHSAFKDYETRQKMIRELLHYSQLYELNGINIDIENVREEDGPLVTQFVREATPYFHEAGLIVSMDITFMAEGNWSAFYERDKLAEIVDYLAIMAYDEHWGSSPKAGSVASLPWVETNLQKLLEIVPNEKLILGIPLYTRLWEIKDSGEVSSKSKSMAQIKEWLTTNNLTPIYDAASGQNYAELYVPDKATTYKVWLEDEQSLTARTNLAVKYDLAGVASWSRYFGDETAWTALQTFNQQIVKK
ncbi:glycosyl hydrolase family 18 protein [Robertmurraya korlensis]|uniref:glycosyl hydrolase family 18 protein n=1 Tax=Robertmurraya korlensis TaxID=519977 RepID=UPI00203BADB4|nr:glycosyl hydrolase family 18 protein [Robertmurraya korlensis]MCM3603694.1 glycosyl hydrolase family 18 protein [Robertmurraya korlensis]